MTAIGIGNPEELKAADYVFESLEQINISLLNKLAAI